MRKTLSVVSALIVLVTAAPGHAQGVIGSTVQEMQAIMPSGAHPVAVSTDGATVAYHDIAIGETFWSDVVMHFDASQRLSSMSFHSKDMTFEDLKARAQTQYDAYVAGEMKAFLTSGAPFKPMQVRICEKPGAGVVMTFEQPTQAL